MTLDELVTVAVEAAHKAGVVTVIEEQTPSVARRTLSLGSKEVAYNVYADVATDADPTGHVLNHLAPLLEQLGAKAQ